MTTSTRCKLLAALLALTGSLAVNIGAAAVITLTPSSTVTTAGGVVTVDVSVSALGSGVALGAFDLDLGFNPALLTPTAVDFGPFLGDPALIDAVTDFSFLTPGVVDFSMVSFLTEADLASMQPASFSLATLTFDAIGAGTAAFALLGSSSLFDASGAVLPIAPTAVPEPGTMLLLLLGIAGLASIRNRRARYALLPQ